jgi:hypothetical protein
LQTIGDNLIRCVRRVLDQTTDTGVGLGIENHGRFFNDPAVLDPFSRPWMIRASA